MNAATLPPSSDGYTLDAEEQRLPTDELFALLVQSVKDYAILMLDPSGRIVSWNEGAERIKGYSAGEIIGRSLEHFYPPEAVARGFPKYELDVASRDGRFEDEGWRVRKDGTRFWANVLITAIRSRGGDEDIGPESCSVLADPPTFVLGPD